VGMFVKYQSGANMVFGFEGCQVVSGFGEGVCGPSEPEGGRRGKRSRKKWTESAILRRKRTNGMLMSVKMEMVLNEFVCACVLVLISNDSQKDGSCHHGPDLHSLLPHPSVLRTA